jgi:hypothetical protein
MNLEPSVYETEVLTIQLCHLLISNVEVTVLFTS